MNHIPLAALSQFKLKQLRESQSDPPFYLTIETSDYDQTLKTIIYCLQIGYASDHTVITHNKFTRYSALRTLDQKLKTTIKHDKFAPFPPKTYLGIKTNEQMNHRESMLQAYLISLTKIAGILTNDAFAGFFGLN